MKILQRIWNDIRAGDNIDQYITITAAIFLTFLNLFGMQFQSYLPPLILAVLALIAINSLGNRYKIDELLKNNSNDRNFFIEHFPETYLADFDNADVVLLFGVSLRRTIQTNYQLIEKKLQRGQKIKVMLINPYSIGAEIAVSRNYADRGIEPKQQEILYILKLLSNLKHFTPNNIEIRTTNFPLAYGVTAIDPHNTVTGKFYIEHYGFRVSTDSTPRFILKISDGRWYDQYKREIEALWDNGTEWVV